MISKHYKSERSKRENFIRNYFHGNGKVVESFIVDKGHRGGIERHDLTNKGIVIVRNAISNKLITKLIARPGQIKKYYKKTGRKPPKHLLKLAYKHQNLKYNYR